MPEKYIPVSCEMHSELELHAMHKDTVNISWHNDSGKVQHSTGIIQDVTARQGAEYLVLASTDETIEIRLDWIQSISD